MSKIAAIVSTIGAIVTVGTGLYLSKPVAPPDINLVRDATVELVMYSKEGNKIGTCSGSLIDDPYLADGDQVTILTAGHCAKDGVDHALVALPWTVGNARVEAETFGFNIVSVDTVADIAIYQADGIQTDRPRAKIYGGNVSFGDFLTVSGFPLGLPQDLATGWASFVICEEGFAKALGITSCEWLRNSVPTSPGSSGSGIYKLTDTGYEIAGVVSAGYSSRFETSSKFAMAVTIENLRSYIKRFSENGPETQSL